MGPLIPVDENNKTHFIIFSFLNNMIVGEFHYCLKFFLRIKAAERLFD